MLQSIIGKPWTKLQNIGQGIIMAQIYWNILIFRKNKKLN
jgi:hypothetical protein